MTARHFILKAYASDHRLRWMLVLSFIIHLIIFVLFMGRPPDSSQKIFFSPVYSVSLVEMPPSSAGGTRAGSAGKPGMALWQGPSAVSSQVKSMSKRSHPVLTISKKSQDTASTTKTTQSASQAEQHGTGGAQATQSGPAGSGVQGTTGSPYPYGRGRPDATTADLRFNQYYQAVWGKIKSAWILPKYGDSRKTLEAIVIIRINKNGRILKIDFEKKSGDANLDRSVIRAIKKADPLPPLPVAFRENVLELGIRFIPGEEFL